MAAGAGDSLVLQFLVKEFCSEQVDEKLRLDINEQCASDGFTPLHCLFEDNTSREELKENVMLLLQYGANPSLRNLKGQDCIEYATNEGFPESAKMMIAARIKAVLWNRTSAN